MIYYHSLLVYYGGRKRVRCYHTRSFFLSIPATTKFPVFCEEGKGGRRAEPHGVISLVGAVPPACQSSCCLDRNTLRRPWPAHTLRNLLAGRFLLLHGARLQSSPMQEHQGPQTQAPTQTAESSKSIDPSNVAPGQQRSHQRTHLHTPQYSELRPAHMPIQCGRWKAFLVRGWLIFRPPFAQILERTQAGRIRVGWSRPPQPNLASGLQDRDRGRA